MSRQQVQPVENVGRGTTFALLAIPASLILFAIVGGLLGIVTGLAAIVVPYIAAWLYSKGAGAPLSKAGWPPFISISVVAIILGTVVGVVGGFYNAFTRVGGDGGLLGSAFWTTVRLQLTDNIDAYFFPIFVGLALGGAGIIAVLRGRHVKPAGKATAKATGNPAKRAVPPAAPTAPLQNKPSPGIILNGKPLDPDKN